jgi:DNA-directed RNA polymerase subunit RPC12/RpoP
MVDYTMRIIAKPREDSITIVHKLFKGGGYDNLHCGGCGRVVCEGVDPDEFADLVLRCPYCGLHNVIPT